MRSENNYFRADAYCARLNLTRKTEVNPYTMQEMYGEQTPVGD